MNFFLKSFLLKIKNTKTSPFTKDLLLNTDFNIGDFSYGKPIIYSWDNKTKLSIGKFCSIADNVKILLGGNHRTDWVSTYPFNVLNNNFENGKKIVGHPISKGDVLIGNDVWIGNDVTVLSGVSIGDGAVIGAGSVISKSISPYEIVVGNPSKIVKKRFDDELIIELLKIAWWNWPIDKINDNLHLICSNEIADFVKEHKVI
jgi:acetyltransferase-like isoleucine patch superfamily enzyme